MSLGALTRRLLFGGVIALAIGFVVFAQRVHTMVERQSPPQTADAIVALTGGEDRIAAGVELLRQRRGARLLISGVHPDASIADLHGLAGGGGDVDRLFDCCVDIDRAARTTLENGAETAAWARLHDFESVIVVTSDYHMPRALLVMRRAMPEVELHAYAVARADASGAWWRNPREMRRLTVEYGKYLYILAQDALPGRAHASGLGREE